MYCLLCSSRLLSLFFFLFFFFFNDTATTEIYTLSLHDALPISGQGSGGGAPDRRRPPFVGVVLRLIERERRCAGGDRKSTRLNSSHDQISYAVFCLKKKKKKNKKDAAGEEIRKNNE